MQQKKKNPKCPVEETDATVDVLLLSATHPRAASCDSYLHLLKKKKSLHQKQTAGESYSYIIKKMAFSSHFWWFYQIKHFSNPTEVTLKTLVPSPSLCQSPFFFFTLEPFPPPPGRQRGSVVNHGLALGGTLETRQRGVYTLFTSVCEPKSIQEGKQKKQDFIIPVSDLTDECRVCSIKKVSTHWTYTCVRTCACSCLCEDLTFGKNLLPSVFTLELH